MDIDVCSAMDMAVLLLFDSFLMLDVGRCAWRFVCLFHSARIRSSREMGCV